MLVFEGGHAKFFYKDLVRRIFTVIIEDFGSFTSLALPSLRSFLDAHDRFPCPDAGFARSLSVRVSPSRRGRAFGGSDDLSRYLYRRKTALKESLPHLMEMAIVEWLASNLL